jgi:phosphate-selective porin OprO and OprP
MKTHVGIIRLLLVWLWLAGPALAAESSAQSKDIFGSLADLSEPMPSGTDGQGIADVATLHESMGTGSPSSSEEEEILAPEPSNATGERETRVSSAVGGDSSAAGIEAIPPERAAEMYDRVLDLEPNAQTRRLVERVRAATEETEIGVDTTDQPWVHVKDNSFLTWGGQIQGDWVNWANDSQFSGQSNYVEFRRLRLFAAGEGYGVYDYKLELEFAPEVDLQADVVDDHVDLGGFGVELKDAYLGIHDIPRLGYVRFGHFKVPIGLEELTSSNHITFLERSLSHQFLPGRELGVAAYNHSVDENVTWSYGAFFDDMSESSHVIEDDNQGARVAGRATWTPWYDELSEGRYLIHTGLGYCYTRPRRQDDPLDLGLVYRPVEFAARPEIHRGDPLVDTGEINCQQYHVLDAELAWVRGRFSAQSELVWTRLDASEGGARDLRGAYVYFSYFLTGEHRAYDRETAKFGRVTPHENFWMVRTPRGTRTGWGAWELAARWSYLDFSEVANQRLHDLTVGCNWYWNPHTRMMFNWIHPFAANSPVAAVADAQGDIVAMRLQVEF